MDNLPETIAKPGTPIEPTAIKSHKPKWLQVWVNGIWTDRVVCSTCGVEKPMDTMSTSYPDPGHVKEESK